MNRNVRCGIVLTLITALIIATLYISYRIGTYIKAEPSKFMMRK